MPYPAVNVPFATASGLYKNSPNQLTTVIAAHRYDALPCKHNLVQDCRRLLAPPQKHFTMNGLNEFLVPYLVSQVVALGFLWAASKNTRLARLLFFLLFLWAAGINGYLGFTNPDSYLGNAPLALPFYRRFILGWFSRYNHLLIPAIAFGQLLIAIGMLLQGWWVRWACIGVMIFLAAIIPLMVGSAFPFSLIAGAAAWLVYRRDSKRLLWQKPVATNPQQQWA